MPKRATPLTDATIRQRRKPGVLTDGGGLRLRVEPGAVGADGKATFKRRWLLRVTVKGLGEREAGLGGYPAVSLAKAREITARMREQAKLGIDPFEARKRAIEDERQRAAAEAARRVRFREVCEEYVAAHAGTLKNAKHRQRSESSLKEVWAAVVGGRRFGDIPVAEITTEHVLAVLKPLWATTTESASRLRGRIERVLASAIAKGLRAHPNPAAWRENLQALLPPPRRIAPVVHHKALPYAELPAFMAALADMPGMGAKALAFVILTAARSGEVRGMTWGEVDLEAKVWVVPAVRMKARREHRVPLSDAALAILRERLSASGAPDARALVFPGSQVGRADKMGTIPPLSDMTLTAVLKRMAKATRREKTPAAYVALEGLTAHGFRSTFRDWCGEQTSFPREVAEAALAHVVADKVEAAYARGDLFAKRRKLMDAWANYCESGLPRERPSA